MYDPILDRAESLLRGDGRVAMTVAEIAHALRPHAVTAAALERRLEADPRFIILDTGAPLSWLDDWPASARTRYGTVLRALDLAPPRLVLLAPVDGASPDRARAGTVTTIVHLLRRTAAELLDDPGRPGAELASVAVDAERARGTLSLTLGRGTGAPSTTRLPGPPHGR